MDKPSAELLVEWMHGSQSAADELFRRYIGRLTALARGKISPRLRRRLDAEDVALSAYRSFFVRARTGRVSLEHSGAMWRLLVAIAVNKLHRQVLHHQAGKRSLAREQSPSSMVDEPFGSNPVNGRPATALEAAVIAEEFERFIAQLSSLERRVLELRMQDYPQCEIAVLVERSERTVRRILTDLQQRLEQRLFESHFAGENQESNWLADGPGIHTLDEASTRGGAAGEAPSPGPARSPHVPPTFGAWLSDADFQLSRHLGTGGSGKVYQAWWRSASEWVAVKVLKKQFQSDREAVERFIREAVTVSSLQHPGIVPIRGVGRFKSGGYFLVLELMPAGDLSALMSERPIELAEALRWVAQAASAVDFAHRQGVIHCDLKPSNLLLDSTGTVRVADFGLAHVRSPGSLPRSPAGTLGFMTPEQIDSTRGEVGPPTDVFGLGAVLFALLTGAAPFVADTAEETIERILSAAAPSVRAARPNVPEAVEAICRRCLSRRPEDRFENAAELVRAIQGL